MKRLALACAAVGLLGMGWLEKQPTRVLDEVDARIRAVLPLGSSVEEVVMFLDASRLSHTVYLQPERVIYVPLRPAIKGDAPGNFELQFWFGSDDRLIHYTIRELAQ